MGIMSMPGRVGIPERVVEHVGVAVEGLGVAGPGHHRVRADEPAQGRVVEAHAVIVEAQRGLLALAGEAVVGGRVAAAGAVSAIRVERTRELGASLPPWSVSREVEPRWSVWRKYRVPACRMAMRWPPM